VSTSDAALTGIGLTFNQRVFAGTGNVTLSLTSVGSTLVENFGVGSSVTYNNDADPPNITITPSSPLTVGTKYAISYPSGAFIKNTGAGSSFVGTAYTFTTKSYSYELWCWGTNTVGNLGQNNETKYSSPVQIPGTNWMRYVAGDYQAFGIKDDNTLWAWGRDLYGTLGQNKASAYASSPVQIPGTTWSSTLGKFDSGSYEDCVAVKTDGTLWTWGKNDKGQLGQNENDPSNGGANSRSSPTQIPGTDWNICSAGAAVSAAIKTNGTLWVWGDSVHGVLGQNQSPGGGGNNGFSSPVQVPGTTWSNIEIQRTSMFAIKTNGTLWAWGYNSWGNLGLNNTTKYSSPVQIPGTTWSILPHPNGGSSRVSQSLMRTDGTLWVMGYNGSFGHLGQNNTTPYSSPKQVGSETTWSTHSHSYGFMGGVKTDGTLWNWGRNDHGNLGQNSVSSPAYQGLSSPVQIPGTTWHQYSAGGSLIFAGAIKKI